jgi:WD40 repeat protein
MELLTFDGAHWSVAFSPIDNSFATGSSDGKFQIYTLSTEELLDIAESRVTRTLTEAECQQYLHLESCPGEE